MTRETWRVLGDDGGFDGVPFIDVCMDLDNGGTIAIAWVQPELDDEDDFVLNDRVRERAKIVAAGPDLLWALETVLDSLGALCNPNELYGRGIDEDVDEIYAAMNKARGKNVED